MKEKVKDLIEQLLAGNTKALSRVISLSEDCSDSAVEIINEIFPKTGQAKVIGLTGAPGAGKSSLVNQLVTHLVAKKFKVGVLATDPSSPISGGAVLGDRIRMNQHFENSSVFIRSMANRGALGGISESIYDAVFSLDAAGFDYILIETVGVGQSEVDIAQIADTVVVVLVPGMGDHVQLLKSGILEIGDVFAVNKADIGGADQFAQELLSSNSLGPEPDWKAPIVKTDAISGLGVDELLSELQRHHQWAKTTSALENRRQGFLKRSLAAFIEKEFRASLASDSKKQAVVKAAEREIETRTKSPKVLARQVLDKILN